MSRSLAAVVLLSVAATLVYRNRRALRHRLNLALTAALVGYLLIAAVRLWAQPPDSDQLVPLVAVVLLFGLLWLVVRLTLVLLRR